ncbi:MAG: nitrilase-related carbon-nitrogen hydrolase [Sutterella wadsworthensis]
MTKLRYILICACLFVFGTLPAAAAQGGHHACGRRTWGHSRIIDAWGGMVSELASGTGIVIGNIERSQLENVRSTLPALASRTIY